MNYIKKKYIEFINMNNELEQLTLGFVYLCWLLGVVFFIFASGKIYGWW